MTGGHRKPQKEKKPLELVTLKAVIPQAVFAVPLLDLGSGVSNGCPEPNGFQATLKDLSVKK